MLVLKLPFKVVAPRFALDGELELSLMGLKTGEVNSLAEEESDAIIRGGDCGFVNKRRQNIDTYIS